MNVNLRTRNVALLFALGGMAALFYSISFVRIAGFGQ